MFESFYATLGTSEKDSGLVMDCSEALHANLGTVEVESTDGELVEK